MSYTRIIFGGLALASGVNGVQVPPHNLVCFKENPTLWRSIVESGNSLVAANDVNWFPGRGQYSRSLVLFEDEISYWENELRWHDTYTVQSMLMNTDRYLCSGDFSKGIITSFRANNQINDCFRSLTFLEDDKSFGGGAKKCSVAGCRNMVTSIDRLLCSYHLEQIQRGIQGTPMIYVDARIEDKGNGSCSNRICDLVELTVDQGQYTLEAELFSYKNTPSILEASVDAGTYFGAVIDQEQDQRDPIWFTMNEVETNSEPSFWRFFDPESNSFSIFPMRVRGNWLQKNTFRSAIVLPPFLLVCNPFMAAS